MINVNDCKLCLCSTCEHEQDRNYCGGCEQCKVENRNKNITNCLDYDNLINIVKIIKF